MSNENATRPARDTTLHQWERVTREEWETFIQRFPDRRSYKTGIVEPPQEICEWPTGRAIASVTFGDWPDGAKDPDWNVKVYKINKAIQPPA